MDTGSRRILPRNGSERPLRELVVALLIAVAATIVVCVPVFAMIRMEDRGAAFLLVSSGMLFATLSALAIERRRATGAKRKVEDEVREVHDLLLDDASNPTAVWPSLTDPAVSELAELVVERQLELTARKDTLAGILDGFGEGILAIDSNETITLANQRLFELFDIRTEIVGRKYYEAVRDVRVRDVVKQALGGSPASARIPVMFGSEQRTLQLRGAPTRRGDAVALFVDITELERLSRIRRDFIADFSHEVRTPLTALRSSMETLEEGGLEPSQESELRQIMLRQLARLEKLVSGLSELRTLESGEVKLKREEVDMVALLEGLRRDFDTRAIEAGVKINLDSIGETVVLGDRIRLEQVFSNLIDNALRHATDTETLQLNVANEGDFVVVRVIDQGPGISPADRERIFNRFYRIDKSRESGGTGLGLAIVRHLVLLHGGSIRVEPGEPDGSIFVVSLPSA